MLSIPLSAPKAPKSVITPRQSQRFTEPLWLNIKLAHYEKGYAYCDYSLLTPSESRAIPADVGQFFAQAAASCRPTAWAHHDPPLEPDRAGIFVGHGALSSANRVEDLQSDCISWVRAVTRSCNKGTWSHSRVYASNRLPRVEPRSLCISTT